MNRFVYIVDSYFDPTHAEVFMRKTGANKDDFDFIGAGGSSRIFHMSKRLRAENLLVFMSSFHGSVEPAEALARRIKEANPNARIIFRSNTEQSKDPVFERNMSKTRGADFEEFYKIVREFLEQHGGVSTPVEQP